MKDKVARAVGANVGRRREYEKRLTALFSSFLRRVTDDLVLHLFESGALAQDASLSYPKTIAERSKLRKLTARIDQTIKRDPEALSRSIDRFIQMHIGDWAKDIEVATYKVMDWYVRNCAYDISASQRRALMTAGIKSDVFKERWRIPLVKNRFISPNAAQKIPEMVEANTALITKMAARDVARLRDVMLETLSSGGTVGDIRSVLATASGFDEARARRVALDQTLKIDETIQSENAKSLGIKKGIWIHVPGQYSSRETHMDFDGKEFDLDKGLYDKDVGRYVRCKELPFCRCRWRSVIPKEFLV